MPKKQNKTESEKVIVDSNLAKMKLLQKFNERIGNGDELKPGELKLYLKLDEEFNKSENGRDNKRTGTLTSKEVLDHLQISKRMLSYHTTKGNLIQNEDGTYDIAAVKQWEEKYHRKKKGKHYQSLDEQIQRAELRWRKGRARLQEMLVNERKGQLMDRKEVYKEWAARLFVLFSGIDNWINRLSPLLEGKEKDDIALIMKKEVFDLRKTFAETGKYCPEVENDR